MDLGSLMGGGGGGGEGAASEHVHEFSPAH